MRVGYYPGCSLEGVSSEYDESIRTLFNELDVTLEDLPDWICCGTLAASSTSNLLGLATPLWNVAQARQQGFDQLVAPCSACVYHFKNAARRVAQDAAVRAEVEAVLGLPLDDPTPAMHPLELLSGDSFEERIKEKLHPAHVPNGLKAVCYYGCHISRPASVMEFDDPENPTSMDRVMGWAGIETLDWRSKVDCCGAHFSLIRPDIVIELCSRLFASALEVGAEAIIVGCPMCHASLDTRQKEIGERLGQSFNIPVLYFSQVLGYAMGLPVEKLGLKKHLVDPLPLMLSRCQARSTGEVPS